MCMVILNPSNFSMLDILFLQLSSLGLFGFLTTIRPSSLYSPISVFLIMFDIKHNQKCFDITRVTLACSGSSILRIYRATGIIATINVLVMQRKCLDFDLFLVIITIKALSSICITQ